MGLWQQLKNIICDTFLHFSTSSFFLHYYIVSQNIKKNSLEKMLKLFTHNCSIFCSYSTYLSNRLTFFSSPNFKRKNTIFMKFFVIFEPTTEILTPIKIFKNEYPEAWKNHIFFHENAFHTRIISFAHICF